MATTIGWLNMKLSADISGFQASLKTASQLAGQFSRSFNMNQLLASSLGGMEAKTAAFNATVKGMVSQIPYAGGALAGAADAGQAFVGFLRESTKEMATQIKTAEQLGVDYNDFHALVHKAGDDFEAVTKALKTY